MTDRIQEYSKTEASLAELRERYGATVWVVETTEQMKAAKAARAVIKGVRVDLEAERKRIKAPALARCNAIDAEAKRITAELREIETPIDEAIKAVEAAKAEEKASKERAEAKRVETALAEVAAIRALATDVAGCSSSVIESAILGAEALDTSRDDEFLSHAVEAKAETVAALASMLEAAKADEAERAKVEAERAELAELRAKQVAAEAEARAAREKEEYDARVARVIADAEARAAREKADSEARKAREKADAEARKIREKEEARLRKIRDAKEAEECEARAREAARADAVEMLTLFVKRHGGQDEFAGIASQIATFLDSRA